MEDRLVEALLEKYKDKKVKEEFANEAIVEEEELLEEKVFLDDEDEDDSDSTITMSIQIELEDDSISDIFIEFHTSCWGDSGLGEEYPEDYWTYDECYDAAAEFIEEHLE